LTYLKTPEVFPQVPTFMWKNLGELGMWVGCDADSVMTVARIAFLAEPPEPAASVGYGR
jgi:hypothetical protein